MNLRPNLRKVFIYTCGKKYKDKNNIERFITNVNIGDKCWEWNGHRDKDGYGRFHIYYTKTKKQTNIGAHKVSYELFYGKLVPGGMCVCHTCDNPTCVNPNHLWLGTNQDNMDDKINKGRQIHGENHHRAKLNWEKVKEIRVLYNNGENSREQLSKLFEMDKSTISDICNNIIWHDTSYIKTNNKIGNTKLTQKIADEIRKLHSTCEYTGKQLGTMFNISGSCVSEIIRYKRW